MEIREELYALNAGFAGALAQQDVQDLVERYTDDAQLLFPGRPILRGREAIESTMRALVADGPVNLRFETRDVMADGALVVEIGETIPSAGPRGKYVVVYRRLPDGSLRIAVDAPSGMGDQPRAE